MNNINSYFCPICNKNFPFNTSYTIVKDILKLDKQYQYQKIDLLCSNCQKTISGVFLQLMTFWDKEYEYYYKKFSKNYSFNIIENKKYLYAYFPFVQDQIIKNIFRFINFNKFDVLVIPECYQKFVQFDKQLCVLPMKLFQNNVNNIYPNYLVQKMIINESQKFTNSRLYSIYNTFFYKFNKVYGFRNWQKLKLIMK